MADQTPVKPESRPIKMGQKVEVLKDQSKIQGIVAYVGTTLFSPGKWVGVVLEEPKGRNNGTVMGKTYFACKDNHGVFVRPTNCTVLEEADEDPAEKTPATPASAATSGGEKRMSRGKPTRPVSVATKSRKSPLVSSKNSTKRSDKLPVAAKTPAGSSPIQDATPVKEEPGSNVTTPRGDVGSKRASFVETGFVETLKTQFTPGQPLSPSLSMAIEERVSVMQLQHENNNLKGEIRDLNEKLETLKLKRNQDREKLKEADKVRLQLDQLMEFRKAILDSQAQLQKELQKAKQEAKDALLERQQQSDEYNELNEMVEMATLDKEMAEEKAESLQLELDQAKQRIEELTLDFELLKAELSNKGGEGAGASLQVKQLEQQNARLKDTLVKMRDLAAHEKHQQQRLEKELEQRDKEIAELSKAKQSLATQVEEQAKAIAELQEQVDAALGAEEMVEQLADRNLSLEERISELQEAVADLEQLHDMNEELQETARETELELREELDMCRGKIREITKERDAASEVVADRNTTIEKFREVVQQLQAANQELRDALQRETNRPVGAPPEVIDYHKMFTETKTFSKTVDLELRKLDLQQALQHVQYLCAYMPESFMARGGDHDSVQVLLLVPRVLYKCDVLLAQIKEKFPRPDKLDTSTVLKSHVAEQYSFGCRLSKYLYSIQCVARQYIYALNCCSPDSYLKMGTFYPEMAVQEKALDFYVDLLRKDQLDENVNLDGLQKLLGYLASVYSGHFSEISDSFALITDSAKVLTAACECITTDAARLQIMMQVGHEGSDVALCLKEILNHAQKWQNYGRTLKRRLPSDGSAGPINLPNDVKVKLAEAANHVSRLVKALQDWARSASQQISLVAEGEGGVSVTKLRELAHAAAERAFAEDDMNDAGFFENVRVATSFTSSIYSMVSAALVDGHYDFDGTPDHKMPQPVAVRAQTLRSEIKDLENLRHKVEQRDAVIKDLNVLLKNKQEELSEMNVRKEMSEKKLSNTIRDNEVALEKITRKLEDKELLLKRKEKEFQETLEHLQSDLACLEKDRAELKERLMSSSKKVLLEGLVKATTAQVHSPTSVHPPQSLPSMSPVSAATGLARDSPLLLKELASVKEALRLSQAENSKLLADKMNEKLAALRPISLKKTQPLTTANSDNKKSDDAKELLKKSRDLQMNLLRLCSQSKVVDPTKKPTPAAREQKLNDFNEMQREVVKLKMSVARLAAAGKAGALIETDLNSFPNPELTKASQEIETIGKIVLSNTERKNTENQPIPVLLSPSDLRQLHLRLLP